MAHKNKTDRLSNGIRNPNFDSTESDYSDAPESRSSDDGNHFLPFLLWVVNLQLF